MTHHAHSDGKQMAGLMLATELARQATLRRSANGVRFASFGEVGFATGELERIVQAVPATIAASLNAQQFYFVPLAMNEDASEAAHAASELAQQRTITLSTRELPRGEGRTRIATAYSAELAEQAICHRTVRLGQSLDAPDGVFISTRLLGDRFALSFEFFINAAHAFVDATGVPASIQALLARQLAEGVKGETSIDAWEHRAAATGTRPDREEPAPFHLAEPPAATDAAPNAEPSTEPSAMASYEQAAFADAVAIYLLSLAIDFDYADLREREYPLIAPAALAERLRAVAALYPPNDGYEFAIRYRRKA